MHLCLSPRKLEKLLDGTPQSDPGLKYLTGEWFYEAKSRRHMDKIHGSEIIWASMKQRRPGLGVFALHCWQRACFKVRVLAPLMTPALFTFVFYLLSSSRLYLQRYYHDPSDVFCLPWRIKCFSEAKPKFKSNLCTDQLLMLHSGLSVSYRRERDQSKAAQFVKIWDLNAGFINISSFGADCWQLKGHKNLLLDNRWKHNDTIRSAEVKHGARRDLTLNRTE